MNIIIDGYNIIKQVFAKTHVSEKERAWFMNKLTEYAHRKKHTLYVVFDGGPYERPTIETRGVITKVYSGRHKSADEVIKNYIEEQVLKPMIIVTTDRQVNAYAARHKVPSIDSLDFYKLLIEDKAVAQLHGLKRAPGKAHKLNTEQEHTELDTLMEEAASVLLYKEEDQKERTKSGQKIPKEERQMLKILKKL